MGKKYSTLTMEEKTRYWETFHQTCDTLRFSIIDLKVAAAGAERSSAASAILAEQLRLEGELALLESQSTAVAADDVAIVPPSGGDVDTVIDLAKQVDILTVNAETFRGVIQLAEQALEVYAKTRV
jgi:hypothetical protein